MNSSSSFRLEGNFSSGYSNSNPNNPDFSFKAPSLQRSSSDNIARPKLLKNRKQLNSHHLKSSGNLENRSGSGFNLFRNPSSSNGNEDESKFSNLPIDITKLNIGNFSKGDRSNKNDDNVGSFIIRHKESEKLHNESRSESNTKGLDEVYDEAEKGFLFKAGVRSDSLVRGSSDGGIKNLNIKGFGDCNTKDKESFERCGDLGGKRDNELCDKLNEFTFQATTSKVRIDKPKTDTRPGGASGSPLQAVLKTSGLSSDKAGRKKDEFCFSVKQDAIGVPFVEFKTLNPESNKAFGSNEKLEFSAKREVGSSTKVKKKKGKYKQPKPVQLWHAPDFVSSKTGARFSREPSITSDEFFSDSQSAVSHAVEKEDIDHNSDIALSSAETETGSVASIERQDSDGLMYYSSPCKSERRSGGFDFTFAACSSPQSQQSSPNRHLKKKNSVKISSLHLSPRHDSKIDVYTMQGKLGGDSVFDKGPEGKREPNSSGSSTAAMESCEKWRLRGNQAYANGDLSKAEEYYMQGINRIPAGEKSRSCLRALMLCYSNLAATRMSLGRMRDALGDCIMAISIDPNFLRVQLRAANCYLSLGEVENAMCYFRKCLQSETDVCVDRKVAVEASDGLQKAQKLYECMHQSALLLQSKSSDDAETALEVIVEALQISLFSEQFLEMKAEALLILGKYEDVIQLCVQTFDSAEKNSPSFDINGQPANPDSYGIKKDLTFRIWRCHMIFKSYFHLGKLEEAIAFLEKQEKLQSTTYRDGSNSLESSIPLVATVRELLTHKAAGNEAFQLGRHLEAVEHYTAALSFNVESRPFAAICFCNRAAAYKSLGQVTDAIADCSLAIALDGNYLKAISRRATLYEKIRDYGKATSDLERLVSLLMKQMEVKKTSKTGLSERYMNLTKDSRQARSWLSEIEEEGRKDVPLDFYLILGVEPSVSAAEIKKAYRKAALRHHPDKAVQSLVRTENGDDKIWKDIREEAYKDADKLFKIIGEAYAVLSDPNKRSRYDSEAETRNVQKKHTGRTSRAAADAQRHPFDRSSSMRSWKEAKGPYGYASSKVTRPNKFF